jgi:hypothetical protein
LTRNYKIKGSNPDTGTRRKKITIQSSIMPSAATVANIIKLF